MTINFQGKLTPGLSDAISAAGHWVRLQDGVLVSSNDTLVNAIISAYDPLQELKTLKIALTKADGVARINLLFPAIKTVDDIDFFAEFWTSIASGSRTPTANFTKIIAIYTAAKNAIIAINAAANAAAVAAVTPAWPP